MLWQFLLYHKVNQLHLYIYPFFLKFFPVPLTLVKTVQQGPRIGMDECRHRMLGVSVAGRARR